MRGIRVRPGVLRAAREKAGLTLEQVAAGQMTKQLVWAIENERSRPSKDSLQWITDRLDLPIEAVLAPDGEPSPEEAALINELDQLSRQSKFKQAAKRGKEILPLLSSPVNVAYCRYYIGEALNHLARRTEAIDQLRLARQIFEAQGKPVQALEAMDREAGAMLWAGDERALEFAEQALERCRSLDRPPPELESRLLSRLGQILVRKREFAGARARLEEALARAKEAADPRLLARIDHSLAVCLCEAGEQGLGIDMLRRALETYEEEERLSGEAQPFRANVMNDLGYSLMRIGQLAEAEPLLLDALELCATTDRMETSHVWCSLAELRLRQHRLQEALAAIERATDLALSHDNKRALAEAHRLRGEVSAAHAEAAGDAPVTPHKAAPAEAELVDELDRLCRQGKYLQVVERGDELLPQMTAEANIAACHYLVGQALTHRWRLGEALERLRLARRMFEVQGNTLAAVEAMDYEARALGRSGDESDLAVAEEALERCRSLHPTPPDTESRLLTRVATAQFRHGDYVRAHALYEEALEPAGVVRDLGQMARIYHGLAAAGAALEPAGERDPSQTARIQLLRRAKALYEAEQRVSGELPLFELASIENDLAMVLMQDGQVLEAEQLLLSTLERFVAAEPDAEYFKSHSLNSLAELRLRQGRVADAFTLIAEATHLAQRWDNKRSLAEADRLRGEATAAHAEAAADALAPPAHAAQAEVQLVDELDRLYRQGKYLQVVERGDELLPQLTAKAHIATCHYVVGQALASRHQPIEALERLRLARQMFEQSANTVAALDVMQVEAMALHLAGDAGAIRIAEEALERCRALDPSAPGLESRILVRVASLLVRKGEFQEAIARYEEALDRTRQVRDLGQMARIYHGRAIAQRDTSDIDTVLSLLTMAHALYEAEESVSGEQHVMVTAIENDIGCALMEAGRLDQAEQRLQVALERCGAISAAGDIKADVLNSLAHLRRLQGRLDEALVLNDQAIAAVQRSENRRALGMSYQVRARLHEARGEPEQAIEWLGKAVEEAASTGVDPSPLLAKLHTEAAPSASKATGA